MSSTGGIFVISKNNFGKPTKIDFFLRAAKEQILKKMYGGYDNDDHIHWWLNFADSILNNKSYRKVVIKNYPELENLTTKKKIENYIETMSMKKIIKSLTNLRFELLLEENKVDKIIPLGETFMIMFFQNSAGSWEAIWTVTEGETHTKNSCEFILFKECFNFPS